MTRDKISAPSVGDCRRWLKELRRNRLYKNASLILKLLRDDELPPIDQCVINRAELMFCPVLRMREKLELCGNRRHYPFYIYKIFDEILEGEQRWVLSHIHLQSEKTSKKCEIDWREIRLCLHCQRTNRFTKRVRLGISKGFAMLAP